MNDQLNIEGLRQLYWSSANAQALLDHCANRTKNQTETKVDRVLLLLSQEGHAVRREDLIEVFRKLEVLGYGNFKLGRKGRQTRFIWSFEMVSVGREAAAERPKEGPYRTPASEYLARHPVPSKTDKISNRETADEAAPERQHAEFIQWMPFVLDALREFGGSATPREVYEAVARLAKVPDEKRFAKLKGGELRFPNQVAWARQYLIWEGFLASPKRGLWMLTDAGRSTKLSYERARQIFQKWVAVHAERRAQAQETQPEASDDATTEAAPNSYKEEMLAQLHSLSPAAFERFCADFLKHVGLERVEVTGGPGDKGIDGEGFLPIGPIVTTKVAFQCKRYSEAVSSKEVQSFQGAIGAAEKGIFFTTGYFTDSSRDAARSPGCKPIELINGDRLVELLEEHEFGLRPAKTYEVDYSFLRNYTKGDCQ
ncbi:MAG: restriction endonuclease [Verrucomicrobia bacterium]|nr:restriction endonuclease [Verrucomicrobiota bacterium]